jgi:hypothetical protein
MSDQPPVSDKDVELQRRKEELESELDNYAQAGAYSPGLIKSARWLSRGLYLAMAAMVVILLFSGWGKVSREVHEGALKRAEDLSKELESVRAQRDRALAEQTIAEARLTLLLREQQDQAQDPSLAARAMHGAADLLERLRGERARARQFAQALQDAQPELHGLDAARAAEQLLRQAAHAPAAEVDDLLRQLSELGREAVWGAARDLRRDHDPRVRREAAWVLSRMPSEDALAALRDALQTEQDQLTRRELLLAMAARAGDTRADARAEDLHLPEAWAGLVLARPDALAPLVEAIATYHGEARLRLLALYALGGDASAAQVMMDVAASGAARPLPERILAVRWLASRRVMQARPLLAGLAEGNDELAQEAERGLAQLAGEEHED